MRNLTALEMLLIPIAVLLFLAYMSKDEWRAQEAVEDAHVRIHHAQQTCKRALDAAERHAAVLAQLMTRDSILTAPGAIVRCSVKHTRLDG